ncbi:hypothetical protein [Rhodobaculum claviforme]|uniref:Uncharacterized protein n=1 Tax=Rhodobaculum claviforme TaxID=1549854 RepID=A0A934TJH9_9RHOB|nr:hypothetical protein [Rhodobaculum claviforme]MBK5926935.1 hypothetical protein [Rhodobaculum claviforme]
MRITSLALIGVVAGVIGLGVWTVGGPGQARAERRDQERMGDLSTLARHLACLQRQGLEADERSESCPGVARRTDPLSGDPYHVDAADVVRVCARFETRLPRQRWGNRDDFDPDEGCLVVGARDTGAW